MRKTWLGIVVLMLMMSKVSSGELLFLNHLDKTQGANASARLTADFSKGNANVVALTQSGGLPDTKNNKGKFGMGSVRMATSTGQILQLTYYAQNNVNPNKGSFEVWLYVEGYQNRFFTIFRVADANNTLMLVNHGDAGDNRGKVEFRVKTAGSVEQQYLSDIVMPVNQWFLLSVDWKLDSTTSSSNFVRVWINGTQTLNVSNIVKSTMILDANSQMGIFSRTGTPAADQAWLGYGDEVRITNNLISDIYALDGSGNFTLPTAPFEALSSYPTNKRFGVGCSELIADYSYSLLGNFGWYQDWWGGQRQGPTTDVEYMPSVGGYENLIPHSTRVQGYINNNPDHYPDGTVWEIGNEIAWDDGRTAADYAIQHYEWYKQIKAANSTYRIMTGAFIPSDTMGDGCTLQVLKDAWDYYKDVLHVQNPTAYPESVLPLDIINIHPYVDGGGDGIDLAEFKQTILDVRQWMASVGLQDKGLWITEMGVLNGSTSMSSAQSFMNDTFAYLTGTDSTREIFDSSYGMPSDSNRLVQKWAWFVMNDHGDYDQTSLFDVNKNCTALGATYATNVARCRVKNDFDGDGISDMIVFYPSSVGYWRISKSTNDFAGYTGYLFCSSGTTSDQTLGGDVNGDGKADLLVYRPGATGNWYVDYSSPAPDGIVDRTVAAGTTGDQPICGDVDGDGKTDLGYFRPISGTSEWYFKLSSTNYSSAWTWTWGSPGDIPVMGDFDGDGKTDITVYRNSSPNSVWYIRTSQGVSQTRYWGTSGDVPVMGDFDGDGKTDLAVYRPSTTGSRFILQFSSTGSYIRVNCGNSSYSDIPVTGDFDGDGLTDVACYRPSTYEWTVVFSRYRFLTSNVYTVGASGYEPVGKHQLK